MNIDINQEYFDIKTKIISNEKLSFFMGKWKFLKFTEISQDKYKYIYDLAQYKFNDPKYYLSNNPNVYYFEMRIINDYILFIFEKKYYDIIQPKYRDIWLIYNIYSTHYLKTQQIYKLFEIDHKINDLDKNTFNIHWIWFRKPNFKLPNAIMKRAISWICMNPQFKFNLWTDLQDYNELLDFISELDDIYKELFLKEKIKVVYHKDVLKFINNFMRKQGKNYGLLIDIFNRKKKHEIIYKTDYLRYMILYELGGIYTDFNDCVCLYPMTLFLTFYENDFIFGRDSAESHKEFDYNNYFIYTKKGNKELLDFMIKSLDNLEQLTLFINDNALIKKSIDLFLNIMTDIKNGEFNLEKYKNEYLKAFLGTIYMKPEFKDFIIIEIKKRNITNDIFLKYLEYVKDYEENIPDIIESYLKTGKINKYDLDLDLITNFFNYNYENNLDELIFINTGIFLNVIISTTNLPFFIHRTNKTNVKSIDNCYMLKYMTYLSFIGHLYDSTSFGVDKKYDDKDLYDDIFYISK
jgi:hypothetical protein